MSRIGSNRRGANGIRVEFSQDSLHYRFSPRYRKWRTKCSVNMSKSQGESSSCQCTMTLYVEKNRKHRTVYCEFQNRGRRCKKIRARTLVVSRRRTEKEWYGSNTYKPNGQKGWCCWTHAAQLQRKRTSRVPWNQCFETKSFEKQRRWKIVYTLLWWFTNCWSGFFRTIISVNQLSVYRAVADMCGELASRISDRSASTGRLAVHVKSETKVAPTDLSTTTNRLVTSEPARGDLRGDCRPMTVFRDSRRSGIGKIGWFMSRWPISHSWMDVEPGEYDQNSLEVSKKMTRLLRHDPYVLRKEDGAVDFRILAQMFRSEFASSPHWSIRTWPSCLQWGGAPKKRLQYCLDLQCRDYSLPSSKTNWSSIARQRVAAGSTSPSTSITLEAPTTCTPSFNQGWFRVAKILRKGGMRCSLRPWIQCTSVITESRITTWHSPGLQCANTIGKHTKILYIGVIWGLLRVKDCSSLERDHPFATRYLRRVSKRWWLRSQEKNCTAKLINLLLHRKRIVLKLNLHCGRQDTTSSDARTSFDHSDKHKESCDGGTYKETCSGEIDFRIQGLLLSAVQEHHIRKEEALQEDQKTKSRVQSVERAVEGMICRMKNMEYFETCEVTPKHTILQLYDILAERYCILHMRNMLETFTQSSKTSQWPLRCSLNTQLCQKGTVPPREHWKTANLPSSPCLFQKSEEGVQIDPG